MVFFKKRPNCKNGEYWITAEKFKIFTEKEKEWRRKNKDHVAKLNKDWYANRSDENKKKCAQRKKDYALRNPDVGRKSGREYNKRNRKKLIKYQAERRKTDIDYRVLCNLRSRLGHAIRAAKADKSAKTKELLGCSVSQFRKHLESTFKKGMSWENYGKWHVDHIVPCSSFDLSKESEQRACFHFRNTQALWSEENHKKHAKVLVSSSFDHLLE
ncbi:hypothetical protein P8625_07 [Verrucomicrobia phage P8625]|uniref:hypothetical protein n=1 Tax=Verrucomicrobia phage P8625 TaxID=1636271 RepID=UPI0005FEB2B3|nr:hypothetical protein AWI59_gp07 [Verrucomicrobia phage P8625]AKA60258.1 hypothetical protein P8625_07 [Verrucomicrobia phage P8625]